MSQLFGRAAMWAASCVALLTCGLTSCSREPTAGHAHAHDDPDAHAESDADAHTDDHGEHDVDQVTLSAAAIAGYGVRIDAVRKHVLSPTLVVPAEVAFNAEAVAHIGSPLRGRVSRLRRVGEKVQRGEVLFVLESPELGEAQSDYLQKRTAAQTAAPGVDLAKNAFERARTLYEKTQGIALTEVQKREIEYKSAQAQLISAQAAVAAARSKLYLLGMDPTKVELLTTTDVINASYEVQAPLDGEIVEREITLGELVGPERDALMIVADLSLLWVLAEVPEARIGEIAVGARATIHAGSASAAALEGTVAFISPAIDRTTRTARARIEIQGADSGLRPGMFVRAELHALADASNTAVLALPQAAVQTIEGETVVFVAVGDREHTFEKRAVLLGASVGGLLPVFSGLSEGEQIVVAGSFILEAELGKAGAHHEH